MLYLQSGDVSNLRYYDLLEQNPEVVDRYLKLFFGGKLRLYDALEMIFTDTHLGDLNIYDMYMITLTLADEVPNPIDYQVAMRYFFALQVNYHNAIGETDGRVESYYIADRVANTCNWNFREYTGYNTLRNFKIEYKTVTVNFNFLLNPIILKIPIVQIEKGLFKTKFRKKNVGFMFNPMMESPGYFEVVNKQSLMQFKLPKSVYMELFRDALAQRETMVFEQEEKLAEYVDTNNHTAVQTMLYDNGFYSVCNFESEGNYGELDENSLLVMTAQYPPVLNPEETRAEWQELRNHVYRLLYKGKFYITYLYGTQVFIMSN